MRRIQTSFFIPNLRKYTTKYLDSRPLSRILEELTLTRKRRIRE
jgi:hypothetical protein